MTSDLPCEAMHLHSSTQAAMHCMSQSILYICPDKVLVYSNSDRPSQCTQPFSEAYTRGRRRFKGRVICHQIVITCLSTVITFPVFALFRQSHTYAQHFKSARQHVCACVLYKPCIISHSADSEPGKRV